jgi:hypothetical protein
MFCPKCGTEYRKGFTTCADCEVPLVSEAPLKLPPVNKPKNIFRQLDDKLISFVRGHFPDPTEKKDIKPHSIITVIAIFFSTSSLSPFFWSEDSNLQTFFFLYRLAFALFCLILYVSVFYSWRVYFILRKEGISSHKNMFFAESAGLFRKLVFYIALLPYFINVAHYRFAPAREYHETVNTWRYASLSVVYHEASLTLFYNLVFLIITVECLRLIYTWSNKKHLAIVLLITTILSAFQLMVRYFISGHGMFW